MPERPVTEEEVETLRRRCNVTSPNDTAIYVEVPLLRRLLAERERLKQEAKLSYRDGYRAGWEAVMGAEG